MSSFSATHVGEEVLVAVQLRVQLGVERGVGGVWEDHLG